MAAHVADPALAPLVFTLVVPCPPERAFDYFTRDIGRWWPLAGHSVGQAESVGVAFEPGVGGRLLETLRDGSTRLWGHVTTWVPGRKVSFSWHPGRASSSAQSVEVSFEAHPQGTRVTLTHGGWEWLGAEAQAKRRQYETGWPKVFEEAYGAYARLPGP